MQHHIDLYLQTYKPQFPTGIPRETTPDALKGLFAIPLENIPVDRPTSASRP